MEKGAEAAGLSPRRRALCRHAVKSVRTPSAMTEEDLAPLRAAGLTDEDLLVLVHVIAFFSGAVRLADGLHVDPE